MVGIDKTSVTASRIINARLYPAVSRPFPSTRVTHTGCSRSTDLWFMKIRNVFSTKYGRAIDSSQNSLDSGAEQYRRRALSFVEKKKRKSFLSFPPSRIFPFSFSFWRERRGNDRNIFVWELSGRSDGKRDSPAPDAINSLLTKQTLNRGPPLRKYSLLYVIKTGIRYGYTEHVDKINW